MRRALLLCCLALAACDRARTHAPPRAAAGAPVPEETFVARPADLAPAQVREVQRALAARGFALEASGRFDGATRTALTDFQRSRGLAATGNLNPETADALGLDPETVMPVRDGRLAAEPPPGPDDPPRPAGDPAARDDAPATRPSKDVAGADAPP